MDIDEIKSLYAEFMGYLSQAPTVNDRPGIYEPQIWQQYNKSIEKLSEISGRDYHDFFIKVKTSQLGESIDTMVYRSKLGGLISKLHAEYFPTLPEPFSGKPSIVITQNQHQNQQLTMQLVFDIHEKINEKMPSLQEGSKEKTFLQKIKGTLTTTSGIVDLLGKIFSLAKECGVTTEELLKLFA